MIICCYTVSVCKAFFLLPLRFDPQMKRNTTPDAAMRTMEGYGQLVGLRVGIGIVP